MSKRFLKNLLILVPIIIMIIVLFLLNLTYNYIRNVAFSFVYDTNVSLVEKFSKEVNVINREDYSEEEYHVFFNMLFSLYVSTIGEEKEAITFVIGDDYVMNYAFKYNKEFMDRKYFSIPGNLDKVKDVVNVNSSGEIVLESAEHDWDTFYYQNFTNGKNTYYMFLTVNREYIQENMNPNQVLIPICAMGLVLLGAINYAIWLKMNSIQTESGD